MGLLDPKSRILDVVLTDHGRKALAKSDLKVAFYSVSDATAFYERDAVSGSSDVTTRVYAECASDLPQDIISLLVNDARQINTLRSTAMSGSASVYGGRVVTDVATARIASGSEFAEHAERVVASSLHNLRNNFVLGSVDDFFEEEEFVVAPSAAQFTVGTDQNGNFASNQTVNVTALEGFFQDPLLSHVDNFMYLPPVNKPSDDTAQPTLLGNYSSLGGDISIGYDEVKASIEEARKQGRVRTFRFDPAPRDCNIHAQFFEQTTNGIGKLDVVDFGTYRGDANNPVRVLFAGKVYQDDFGVETFVRLFTIVLE